MTKDSPEAQDMPLKLKPCPFCGNKDVQLITDAPEYFVVCRKCSQTASTEYGAIRRWNTRASDKLATALEAVVLMCNDIPPAQEKMASEALEEYKKEMGSRVI